MVTRLSALRIGRLYSQKTFLLEAEWKPESQCSRKKSLTNPNEHNENQTKDLSACRADLNQLRHRLPRAELKHFDIKNIHVLCWTCRNFKIKTQFPGIGVLIETNVLESSFLSTL